MRTISATALARPVTLLPIIPRAFLPPTFGSPAKCAGCGAGSVYSPAAGEKTWQEIRVADSDLRYFVPSSWSLDGHSGVMNCDVCRERTPSLDAGIYFDVDFNAGRGPGGWDSFDARELLVSHPLLTRDRILEARRAEMGVVNANKTAAKADRTRDLLSDDREEEIEEEEEEAVPASKKPTVGKKIKGQAFEIGAAAALGVKLAAVDQAGEVMLDVAKQLSKSVPILADMLESPDGRELAKLLVALMLHSTATYAPGIVPKHEFVKRVAELQMTTATFKLLGPRLGELRQYLQSLASIGEQIAEGEEAHAALQDGENLSGNARARARSGSEPG